MAASEVLVRAGPITYGGPQPPGIVVTYPSSGDLLYRNLSTLDWTNPGVPPGVDVFAEVWGGGGGACRGTGGALAGPGGGAGAYAAGTIPAAFILAGGQLVVGRGGTGTTTGLGNAGLQSKVTLNSVILLTAHRGEAGVSDGGPGAGGTAVADGAVVDPTTTSGDNGHAISGAVGGAGGDSPNGGVGGAGGTAADGSNGAIPGAGGGGAGGAHKGGDGAQGQIRMRWPVPT